MTFSNPLLVELVVPKGEEVEARIRGFYESLGWEVIDDSVSPGYTYVRPKLKERAPTIVYGQNSDRKKTALFVNNTNSVLSPYNNGSSLPFVFDLVEICMAVPSDADVVRLYREGGQLLQKHILVPIREYYSVKEFRFMDPFNYVIRVTTNPGWEV